VVVEEASGLRNGGFVIGNVGRGAEGGMDVAVGECGDGVGERGGGVDASLIEIALEEIPVTLSRF